jgi:hypothetical protein
MTRSFDPRLVYAKTPAGMAEVSSRQMGLPVITRRILILIDGHRRLMDLPAFARPDPLEPIVEELESRGLISLVGISEAPVEDNRRDREQRARVALDQMRNEVRGEFGRLLGPRGALYDAQIDETESLDVFRKVLRDAIDEVIRACGRDPAEQILARIRPIYAAFAGTA